MRMHNPRHPGAILESLCLAPPGLAFAAAAGALGVRRKTLSAIPDGRAGISPEIAVRLSIAFGTAAESRLNRQTRYALWHAERLRKQLRVTRRAA